MTATVQFIRNAPVDGVVFTAVAVALIIDALGVLPDAAALPRPGVLPVLAGAAAAGVLLILTPRHGIVDGIVLVAVGLAAAPVAWAGVRPPAPRSRGPRPGDAAAVRRTAILWAVAGIVTCLWELTSFVLGRMSPTQKAEHPAISDLLDPAIDQLWFRAIFVAAWLALGLALLSRGGRR